MSSPLNPTSNNGIRNSIPDGKSSWEGDSVDDGLSPAFVNDSKRLRKPAILGQEVSFQTMFISVSIAEAT